MTTLSPITFSPENEAKAREWLANRGGIAVWRNVNMSSQSLGSETFTPALTDGAPTPAPSWQARLSHVVTDPSAVMVEGKREVARVKVCRSKYGPPADPVSRGRAKLDKALAAAGADAWWEFSYENWDGFGPWLEAVVYVPAGRRPLSV